MSVVDVDLETAAREVSARFRSHGGGVTATVGRDGDVRVGFTGMCAGYPCRAVCLEHTVRPRLAAVPGVRSVSAPGAQVSAEAADRLSAFLSSARPDPTP